MAVCTKLTIKEIELALRDSFIFDVRNDIVVPNVSWGMLPYEADLLGINKSGQCTEVEIKRSFEDFKADFKKDHKHDSAMVTYFYYAIPEAIVDKVKEFLLGDNNESVPGYSRNLPAVVYYQENGSVVRVKEKDGVTDFGTAKRFGYHPVTEQDRSTIGRLGTLRYWDVQRDLLKTGYKSKKDLKIDRLKDNNQCLNECLKRYKRRNGCYDWTKCSDELPNDDRQVLCTNGFGNNFILCRVDNAWRTADSYEIFNRWIVAWRDIPEYEENFKNKSKK